MSELGFNLSIKADYLLDQRGNQLLGQVKYPSEGNEARRTNMTMNPARQKDARPKTESEPDYGNLPKITSSRQWSSYKNPRIVRVSKTFGGKDRHSKVCTVKGLRDRRIRLSVPTAIQLYDLQDRLGLSQPSKVVDWLLDATKHDIDNLPPLPMLPASFASFHHHPTVADGHDFSSHLCPNVDEKMSETPESLNGFVAQNLFPLSHPNPYLHWDLHNLSLSHFGGGGFSFSSSDNQHNYHHQFQNSLSTSAALASSSQQLYFCPSAAAPQTVTVPPFISNSYINSSADSDSSRHANHAGLPTTLHLISSPMRQFVLNVNSKTMGDEVARLEENKRQS